MRYSHRIRRIVKQTLLNTRKNINNIHEVKVIEMENKNIAIVLVVAVVLVGFFALDSLTPKGKPSITPTTRAEETPTTLAPAAEVVPGAVPLSDLQVTACNAADKAQTCQTRLPKLVGLVAKEDCCKYLKKCC
jgi:hypothetical protein